MGQKLSCYIIDDEHLAQKILKEYVAKVSFLELKGSFSSALEAAAQIDQDKPDLLFLDINMPLINGMQCLESLKANKNFRTIPVIMYTTSSRGVDMDRAIDQGATEYVVKSHEFSESYKNIYKAIKKFL